MSVEQTDVATIKIGMGYVSKEGKSGKKVKFVDRKDQIVDEKARSIVAVTHC